MFLRLANLMEESGFGRTCLTALCQVESLVEEDYGGKIQVNTFINLLESLHRRAEAVKAANGMLTLD